MAFSFQIWFLSRSCRLLFSFRFILSVSLTLNEISSFITYNMVVVDDAWFLSLSLSSTFSPELLFMVIYDLSTVFDDSTLS